MKKNKSFMFELLEFIWENKKWWIFPLVLFILFISLFIYLSTSSSISPMIYAMI